MEIEDVAMYLAAFLLHSYRNLLIERYELDAVPETEIEFLELLGARRGCLRAGGKVDLEKVSAILVNEFRSGKLGALTLETPEMISREEKILAQQQQEKAQRDALRKSKKSKEKKANKNITEEEKKGLRKKQEEKKTYSEQTSVSKKSR